MNQSLSNILFVQNCSQYYVDGTTSFTGKERDEETGYSYFGARYYDADLLKGWMSVDPMADKYPSISPYAYCTWNPVKLVDPDGSYAWRPEILDNGKVNYVAEQGDDANTLQKQYQLSKNSAITLYNSMKNGKISGDEVTKVIGNDVLKLRWATNTDQRKIYHLGFAIIYNHTRNNDLSFKLNDFFSEIPQSMGANCGVQYKGSMSGGMSNYTIPVLGGESIPTTYVDCTASGSQILIRDCYGIQEKKTGTVRLQLNVYSEKSGCNGLQVVHIQIQQKYSTQFTESYGN